MKLLFTNHSACSEITLQNVFLGDIQDFFNEYAYEDSTIYTADDWEQFVDDTFDEGTSTNFNQEVFNFQGAIYNGNWYVITNLPN